MQTEKLVYLPLKAYDKSITIHWEPSEMVVAKNKEITGFSLGGQPPSVYTQSP